MSWHDRRWQPRKASDWTRSVIMLTWLTKKLREHREDRQLIEIARNAFRVKYSVRAKYLAGWNLKPERLATGDVIVTLCYDGGGKPPRRTWWRIEADHWSAEELEYDEAARLIQIPNWL